MTLIRELGTDFFSEKFQRGVFVLGNNAYIASGTTKRVKKPDNSATLMVEAFNLKTGEMENLEETNFPDVLPFWHFSRNYTIFKDNPEDVFGRFQNLAPGGDGHRCLRLEQRRGTERAFPEGLQRAFGYYTEKERYKSIIETKYHGKDAILENLGKATTLTKAEGETYAAISKNLYITIHQYRPESATIRYKHNSIIQIDFNNKLLALKEKLVENLLPTNKELEWFL